MFVACDESGINPSDKYLVIGSAWISKTDLCHFESNVTELRLKKKCWGEIEWSKVHTMSKSMCQFYKDFISLGFQELPIFLRFIVVDKTLLDMETYHQNSLELVRFKFTNLMISRYAERFFDSQRNKGLHIVFDSFSQSTLARGENWQNKMRQYIEQHLGVEIEHLQPCCSHICSLVQFCDLFAGAVSISWNKPSNITNTQKELIEHMESVTSKKLNFRTSLTDKEFNLWVWRPSPLRTLVSR